MKYWWVNQGQTFEQEISGGYLWAPKREKDGRRSQFYDNLRLVSPGDLILSYVRQNIIQIGVSIDLAFLSAKPEEFGKIENDWSNDGWLLPVKWQPLNSPIKVKEIFDEISDLLPQKYSPLEKTGRGSQKAYLAEISQSLFQKLSGLGKIDIPDISSSSFFTRANAIMRRSEIELAKSISENPNISTTEKTQLIKSRVGQGLFRSRVSKLEKSCRLTGIAENQFLIASHIKPWRLCASSDERLDGANGLMLTPTADMLFDKGYISFDNKGGILISPTLKPEISQRLLIQSISTFQIRNFNDCQINYLEYHRDNILLL